MSYCVEYNPEMRKRYPFVKRIRNKNLVKVFLVSAAAIAAIYMIACSGVLRYFIPGDPEVTTAAFSLLLNEIGEGEPVREAFLSFCREIIVNAS